MPGFTNEKNSDYEQSRDGLEPGVVGETEARQRRPWWRLGRGGAVARALAAGAGTGALLAALALPAGASGNPNPWDGAQVGLTYPVTSP
jgi:hypothetical protein